MIKYRKTYIIIVVVTFSLFLCSCATMPLNYGDIGKVARENESMIIIQRANVFLGSAVKMNVYLNDQLRLTLGNGDEGMIIVPNGTHTLFAEINYATKSEIILVNTTSNRINFFATPKMGLLKNSIDLLQMYETPL